MKKLAIYFYLTNNINNKPWPEIKYTDENIDYYMFTDDRNHLPDDRWNVIYINAEDDIYSKEDMNKRIKWNPFIYFEGKYEYSLYCDSKIIIMNNPLEILNDFKDKLSAGFTCHKYGFVANKKYVDNTKDVYRHADYLLDVKVGHLDNIRELKKLYKEEGLPLNSGVAETAVVLTDLKSKTAKKLESEIFSEYITRNTKRDQLILPYVMWKNGINISNVELFGNFEENNIQGRYFKKTQKTNVNNRDYSSLKYKTKQPVGKYKAVIALTSWQKRIQYVSDTILNLHEVCGDSYKIVLTLSEEEFKNKEQDLPAELLSTIKKCDVDVIWIYKNYKVFKKILFAMQKYSDLPIISADDDCLYKINYADLLYNEWLLDKASVVTMGKEIIYNLYGKNYYFSHGCASLFPPSLLLPLLKYIDDEKIISTGNDDSFYGIFLNSKDIKIKYLRYKHSDYVEFVKTDTALSVGVKTINDFREDKMIIIEELKRLGLNVCVAVETINKNNKPIIKPKHLLYVDSMYNYEDTIQDKLTRRRVVSKKNWV